MREASVLASAQFFPLVMLLIDPLGLGWLFCWSSTWEIGPKKTKASPEQNEKSEDNTVL